MIDDLFLDAGTKLAERRNDGGYWTGELSSSALGTAVAVIALRYRGGESDVERARLGVRWLFANANGDGGFGDTAASVSNVSTSLLSYAALNYAGGDDRAARLALERVVRYLARQGIDVARGEVCDAILRHYGRDYTFSVPILCACAITGSIQLESVGRIPMLPFELALFPKALYRFLNLSVVSYAIPALIAVGVALFERSPRRGLFSALTRRVRATFVPRALGLLERTLPESGGFLEAIPLTAFVAMSLMWAGYPDSAVIAPAMGFLGRTQRDDGSWPVDVNLSTWVTTLAAKAYRGRIGEFIDERGRASLTGHLLGSQYREVHPFNGSCPGGWGWTGSSGAVPDCDDTPGAVLALLALNPDPDESVAESVLLGCDWISALQNGDGGFPTFSKGWGRLPFDRSCADLTGHAVAAIAKTLSDLGPRIDAGRRRRYERALGNANAFLMRAQLDDGRWNPLWFGNQAQGEGRNPVYGTARVCAYLSDALIAGSLSNADASVVVAAIERARSFLVSAQNADGSWGGDRDIPGTVEETSLALSALAGTDAAGIETVIAGGLDWLSQNKESMPSAPIGFYFASLWYDEALYPDLFYTEAMARLAEQES